jgi:hypothetical protein
MFEAKTIQWHGLPARVCNTTGKMPVPRMRVDPPVSQLALTRAVRSDDETSKTSRDAPMQHVVGMGHETNSPVIREGFAQSPGQSVHRQAIESGPNGVAWRRGLMRLGVTARNAEEMALHGAAALCGLELRHECAGNWSERRSWPTGRTVVADNPWMRTAEALTIRNSCAILIDGGV